MLTHIIIALHLLDLVRQPYPQRESQRGKDGEGEEKKDVREQEREEQRFWEREKGKGLAMARELGVARRRAQRGEGAQDTSFFLRTACVVQSTGCARMHA
jgi:hypothetical protein